MRKSASKTQQPAQQTVTTNTQTTVEPVKGVVKAKKTRVVPWTPHELKTKLRDVKQLYKKIEAGLVVLPPNEAYVHKTKSRAKALLEALAKFEKDYEALYDSTETKRTTNIKPRLCDIRLTEFFQRYFKQYLPVSKNGINGVMDFNKIAPRALSLYIKENNLGEHQFFTLDQELMALFEAPSIENPSKTYIQLIQDRIAEIRSEAGYKVAVSSAEVVIGNDPAMGKTISMNYSALKIGIPKFGIKYDISNSAGFVSQLEEFQKHLDSLHAKLEESKKASKKK